MVLSKGMHKTIPQRGLKRNVKNLVGKKSTLKGSTS